jgi:hypothetical protein
MAGTLRVFDSTALAEVRHEINKIDAHRERRQGAAAG